MEYQKQALVIGALGGLAEATIIQLINKGWRIFAADVQQDILVKYKNRDQIIPVLMDITKDDSIEKAYQQIKEQTTGLHAVINMAGILKIGSMVELSVTDLAKALEINLLGVYRVNKAFLSLILEEKGRIVNLSSEVGRQQAAPFNGIYAISKHALEAYSDALRRELAFLGIKVIKIQPGPFKTNMTKNVEELFTEAYDRSVYFKKNLAKGISYLPNVYKNAHDPGFVAKAIVKALETKRPKTAYYIKPDVSRLILDLLPVKWGDKLINKVLS